MKNPPRRHGDRALAFYVLSMEALDTPDKWEAALTLPFPAKPTSELLHKAGDEIGQYLEWLMYDGVQSYDPEWVRGEIRRACDRLSGIADALPAILAQELKTHIKQEREKVDREYWGGNYEKYKR